MATKRQPRLRGARVQLPRHLYLGDGVPDHRGDDRCRDCGLRRGHVVHELEPVDPDTAEAGRRITGERVED